MRSVVNVLLLMTVVVLIAMNVFLRVDPSRRHLELFPQMAHSVPYDTYAENPNFADGKTLRPLPAGTIVRGAMPLHFTATPADAQRAAVELVSSVKPGDAKAIARGQWVFTQYCQTCHGATGKGDGIVATRGFPMPASLIAPKALQMRDGQMFHVITYGQGNMPSHAAQVAREDRWKVIAYVRTLQKDAPLLVADTAVAAGPASPSAGQSSPSSGPALAGPPSPRTRGEGPQADASGENRVCCPSPRASGERVAEGRVRGAAQPPSRATGPGTLDQPAPAVPEKNS